MNPRRLVLAHTTGRFAGVHQIHGVETGTPLTDSEMPTPVECQLLDGRYRFTEMVWANERAVFYREVA